MRNFWYFNFSVTISTYKRGREIAVSEAEEEWDLF